tara:strand:+ start:89 stop:1348 length:1260 start_codon:yes stop_codon:yes gene_type:complete
MKPYKLADQAVQLEHDFAICIRKQIQWGFAFDVPAAAQLYATLSAKREELNTELQELFPPIVLPAGHPKGLKTKTKTIVFNPGSRMHIAERFMSTGWRPEKHTNEGRPQIDEAILREIGTPEADKLNEYLLVSKRISQLAEGDTAWMKLEKHRRIHGDVMTNSCITGRCAHRHPNMSAVPNLSSPYGKECRSLFTATGADWDLIGIDFSGLEMRVCAHYTSTFDDGALIEEVCDGDIHTTNAKAFGVDRNTAKSVLYAQLYGAGEARLGSLVGGTPADGRKLKKKFYSRWPGIADLQDQIDHTLKVRGYLTGLDGRILPMRGKAFAAINTLFQAGGSTLVKNFTVALHKRLVAEGFDYGQDWAQCNHVHDEVQIETRKPLSSTASEIAIAEIPKSGADFGFRCPLEGEVSIGRNWADTH